MSRTKTASLILAVLIYIFGTGSAGAAGIREILSFLGSGQQVQYSFTAEFEKLPQYDENRTEQLNRIVKHMAFSGILDAPESNLTVSLDGEDLFTVSETASGRTMLFTGDGQLFYIPESALNEEGNLSILRSFSSISRQNIIRSSLGIYAAFFEKLPEYFPELCGRAKILEKYKDYGTAVQKISIRIPAEELTICIREHAEVFPSGQCIPDPGKIVFSGRQDFELLVTDDGKMLRIRYGGIAGYSEEDLRTVRLEWKTVRSDDTEMDELSLRTPDSGARKRNNLILKHSWKKTEDGKETFCWKAETDDLAEGIRIRKISQSSAEAEDGQISGTFSETVNLKGTTEEAEIDFELYGDPEDQCAGTLEIISKKDKIESERLKAGIRFSGDIPALVGDTPPDPVILNAEEFTEITRKLFSSVLLRMMKLPAEDLVFLTEGIPEDTMEAILPDYKTIKEPEQ